MPHNNTSLWAERRVTGHDNGLTKKQNYWAHLRRIHWSKVKAKSCLYVFCPEFIWVHCPSRRLTYLKMIKLNKIDHFVSKQLHNDWIPLVNFIKKKRIISNGNWPPEIFFNELNSLIKIFIAVVLLNVCFSIAHTHKYTRNVYQCLSQRSL